jgi:valyl-tRNA synthetase
MQPYNHQEVEKRIYEMWEAEGYFTPNIDRNKKPFVIILTPPNASGPMHLGNVFSLALQDILARYHRMRGEPTLFLPSTDHGGYETQITYEQELNRQSKSSSDVPKGELYENISRYVQQNNEVIKQQLKVLGVSVDWSRFRFTLDKQAVQSTYTTFKKLRQDGLVKRNKRDINYCPECKTTLPDIEVEGEAVKVCKAGHVVENRKLPVWFVLVDAPHKSLKKPAIDAVQTKQIKIHPLSREDALGCVQGIQDWCIARQNVWGIRIPAWYEVTDPTLFTVWFIDKNGIRQQGALKELLDNGFSWEEIETGLERVEAHEEDAIFVLEEREKKDGVQYLQETDTFDTWFSSTQWAVTTLKESDTDFSYFYPTSINVSGRDLIDVSIAREIMLAYYLTGEPPYSSVYLHPLMLGTDKKHKMSKSMKNAAYAENKDEDKDYIKKFGADVLRMALVSHPGHDKYFLYPEEKTLAYYQHFSHRIWGLGQRIFQMVSEERGKRGRVVWYSEKLHQKLHREDTEILGHLNNLIVNVTSDLEKFRFADALEHMKKFFFEQLNATYLNQVRQRRDRDIGISVLRYIYLTYIALLHPFMPFMTEEIYGMLSEGKKSALIITSWPQARL